MVDGDGTEPNAPDEQVSQGGLQTFRHTRPLMLLLFFWPYKPRRHRRAWATGAFLEAFSGLQAFSGAAGLRRDRPAFLSVFDGA